MNIDSGVVSVLVGCNTALDVGANVVGVTEGVGENIKGTIDAGGAINWGTDKGVSSLTKGASKGKGAVVIGVTDSMGAVVVGITASGIGWLCGAIGGLGFSSLNGTTKGGDELTGDTVFCAKAGTALKTPTVTVHKRAICLCKLVFDWLGIVLHNFIYSQLIRGLLK